MSSSENQGTLSSTETQIRVNDCLKMGGTIHYGESTKGKYTYHHDSEAKCVWLDYVKSYKQGGGFGTEVVAEMVKFSIQEGCAGEVRLDAAWSSHLFYLFMGMIPKDKQIAYTERFGLLEREALDFMSKYPTSFNTEEDIESYLSDPDDKQLIERLKNILRKEKNIPPAVEVTNKDLIDNRDFLLEINTRRVSYISESFIPRLLSMFESHLKRNNSEKYPSTTSFTQVQMVFPDEVKKQWVEAVTAQAEGKPFKLPSFKGLEQLVPYMDEQQKKQWDAILVKLAQPKQPEPFAPHKSALQITSMYGGTAEGTQEHKQKQEPGQRERPEGPK